jgi:hypothetical protein
MSTNDEKIEETEEPKDIKKILDIKIVFQSRNTKCWIFYFQKSNLIKIKTGFPKRS